MYSEILARLSVSEKEFSHFQEREALQKVKQLQKLLWILPKKERIGIVDFIKEEQEHGAFYLSSRIYAQITDTVECASVTKSLNSKTTYISGEKTIYTPYSGIEKDKDKNFSFQLQIYNGIHSLLALNKKEQQTQLNNIVQTPVVYQIRNLVMHTALKTTRFIQEQRERLRDYLLEKRISSSLKRLSRAEETKNSRQEPKLNTQIESRQTGINSVLENPTRPTRNAPTPKKITSNNLNNITKDNQPRIHE